MITTKMIKIFDYNLIGCICLKCKTGIASWVKSSKHCVCALEPEDDVFSSIAACRSAASSSSYSSATGGAHACSIRPRNMMEIAETVVVSFVLFIAL